MYSCTKMIKALGRATYSKKKGQPCVLSISEPLWAWIEYLWLVFLWTLSKEPLSLKEKQNSLTYHRISGICIWGRKEGMQGNKCGGVREWKMHKEGNVIWYDSFIIHEEKKKKKIVKKKCEKNKCNWKRKGWEWMVRMKWKEKRDEKVECDMKKKELVDGI